jgi:hypothetical protein
MKKLLLFLSALILTYLSAFAQDTLHVFMGSDGVEFEDRVMKYDFDEKFVLLENRGKIPLEKFTEDDQSYILHWNQVNGFMSTMRFKMEVKKSNWARMKYEQNITPFYMDAIQIPGKRTPNHNVIMLEDYEEYTAVYMEAEGYEITMRNQNFFPLENIVVESRIFYEQEDYATTESVFLSGDNEFSDTVLTNKVRFLSETLPIIIQHEEVTLYSECAIITDHQIERSSLVSDSENEGEDDDSDDDGTDGVDGFGEWDDHGRRKKGKVNGVWFRVGIKGLDGEMVWRDITSPTSITDKYTWEPPHFEVDED